MQYMQNPQLVNRSEGSDDSIAKSPPWSAESEQAVLGAILQNNDLLDRASEVLSAEHFFDPLHQQIFDAASKLIASRSLASPITMKSYFEGSRPIDATLTVPQYLARLPLHACMPASMRDYAQVIRDMWVRRQLVLLGEDVISVAYDSPVDFPPKEQIEEAEARLFALVEGNGSEDADTLSFDEAKALAVDRALTGEVFGVSTGLSDLDSKLGGLFPTDLVILAGRPSMGKTALATDIAMAAASKGTAVGFFSMEMSADQLAMRVVAQRAEVSSDKFRTGRATQEDFRRLKKASADLDGSPITIIKTGGLTIAQLTARSRRLRRKHNLGLIIVDYLQLMQAGKGRRENRVQDITEITTGLKAMAKELEVPVVALSQLSRNVEHRADKRPQLSDLRESGSIEQDADVVMFVYREDYYVEREEPAQGSPEHAQWQHKLAAATGKAEVIIGKQRHGPIGTVKLAFNPELTKFYDLARQEVRHGL